MRQRRQNQFVRWKKKIVPPHDKHRHLCRALSRKHNACVTSAWLLVTTQQLKARFKACQVKKKEIMKTGIYEVKPPQKKHRLNFIFLIINICLLVMVKKKVSSDTGWVGITSCQQEPIIQHKNLQGVIKNLTCEQDRQTDRQTGKERTQHMKQTESLIISPAPLNS